MSQQDVAVVRSAIDAFIANDFEAWFALASPKIELYPRPEEPGVKERYVGWDEMLEYLVNWYSGWADYVVEPGRYIDADEYVIVEMRETGTAEQTGMRIEEDFAHALKVADGKIVEWRMFGPVDEALEALGLAGGAE